MKCPTDGSDLVMSDRQGIEIDYCPKCRGVWLDRGELDKIIERTAPTAAPAAAVAPPPPPPQQQYSQPGYDNRGYDSRGYDPRYKKKKSILGEIFDF
jgi:Zn-finger nucleic acid-binding protein